MDLIILRRFNTRESIRSPQNTWPRILRDKYKRLAAVKTSSAILPTIMDHLRPKINTRLFLGLGPKINTRTRIRMSQKKTPF